MSTHSRRFPLSHLPPRTYRQQVRLSLLLLSLMTMLMLFIPTLTLTRQLLFEHAESNIENALTLSATAIETHIQRVEGVAGALSDTISRELNVLRGIYPESYYYTRFTDLRQYITNAIINYDLASIRVYTDLLRFANIDNLIFYPLKDSLDPAKGCYSGEIRQSGRGLSVSMRPNDRQWETGVRDMLRFAGSLFNLEGEPICAYALDLDLRVLERCVTPLLQAPGTAAFLLDGEGNALITVGEGISLPTIRDSEHLMLNGRSLIRDFDGRQLMLLLDLDVSGFQLLMTVPYAEVVSGSHYIIVLFSVIFVVTLLFGLGLDLALSRYLTHRIEIAAEQVRGYNILGSAESSIEFTPPPGSRTDDVDELMASIDQLIVNNRALFEQALRESTHAEKYRFSLLQAQINPHFLYNALDTIHILQSRRELELAERTLEALSGFYRIALSKGMDVITLENELKMTENYMQIERVGYQSQIELIIENDGVPLRGMLPKFTLQPLVENAVKHALKPGQHLLVCISLHRDAGACVFVIEDNGVGLTQEQLSVVRQSLTANEEPDRRHFGLASAYQRLELFFGGVEFTVDSAPGQGMRIQFVIDQFGADVEGGVSDADDCDRRPAAHTR